MAYLWTFLFGGLLCVVGQILIDKTKLTPARILVGYVVAGVLLGAVGLYGPFAKFAKAGAKVPLTGFGNTLAQGVREAVDKQGILGIFTGGLSATAAGICAAIVFGCLAALIFRSRKKEIRKCMFFLFHKNKSDGTLPAALIYYQSMFILILKPSP